MTQAPSKIRTGQLLARLARPQNVVYSGLLTVIIVRFNEGTWLTAIACYILIVALYAIAAAYNNLNDIAVDQANHRADNPLSTGALAPYQVRWFIGVQVVVLVALQFWLTQPGTIVLCMIYGLLLLLYSHKQLNVQARGLIAHILLAVCYGSLPVLIAATQQGLNTSTLWLAGFQITLLLPSLLAKDYKDLKGDRHYGKQTPLVRYGAKAVFKIAGSLVLLNILVLAVMSQAISIYWWAWPAISVVASVSLYMHYKRGVIIAPLRRLSQIALLLLSFSFLRG